jgi:hypothetical protein
MDKEYGASLSKQEKKDLKAKRKQQKKERRGKKRADIAKYGRNKKDRAANKAEAATKRKALAQAAIVGGDHRAGQKENSDGNFSYGGIDDTGYDPGASMRKPDMSVPAEKLKYIQNKSAGMKKPKRGYEKDKNDHPKRPGKMDRSGPSMYGKKHGSSMDASQDRSASMDDYSHEKKLKADGRYEAAHGKMANAKNDFDHAHALKKDAHHDARSRISILKHMKKF